MYRVLLGAVSFLLRNAFDYILYSFIRISILQVVATYVALITIRHRDYPSSQSSLSFPLPLPATSGLSYCHSDAGSMLSIYVSPGRLGTGDNWHRCNAKLTLRPIMCIILPLLDAMALRSTTATSSAYQLGTWQWFFTNRIVSPASRKSCLQLSLVNVNPSQVSRANKCVCVCVFVNAAEQPNQRRVIRDALCRAVPSIPSSSLAGCLRRSRVALITARCERRPKVHKASCASCCCPPIRVT